MEKMFEIKGHITINTDGDYWDAFIEVLEANNMTFGGFTNETTIEERTKELDQIIELKKGGNKMKKILLVIIMTLLLITMTLSFGGKWDKEHKIYCEEIPFCEGFIVND